MEEGLDRVVSLPTEAGAAEEQMLRADLVQEMVARKERGEGAKRIARETFENLASMLTADYKANGRRSLDRVEDALGHLREYFAEAHAIEITRRSAGGYDGRE